MPAGACSLRSVHAKASLGLTGIVGTLLLLGSLIGNSHGTTGLSRFLVVLFHGVIRREMSQHLSELVHLIDSFVQFTLQLFDHCVALLDLCLLRGGTPALFRWLLNGCELQASRVDVRDRVNDLADLLIVFVFALNFILEIRLQGRVLQLNSLKIVLESCHFLLLLMQLLSHLPKGTLFIFFHLLHSLVNAVFPLIELFVFVLQVNETAMKSFDSHALSVVAGIFVSRPAHNSLEKLGILVQIAELSLSIIKLLLLLLDMIAHCIDYFLVFECRRV